MGGSEGTEEVTRELKQDKGSTGTGLCPAERTQATEAPPPKGPEEWMRGSSEEMEVVAPELLHVLLTAQWASLLFVPISELDQWRHPTLRSSPKNSQLGNE